MEATVKCIVSPESGFLLHPGGGKDIYFHVDDQQLLPGEQPTLPGKGTTVIVSKLSKSGKSPRARKWVPK